MNLLTRYVTGLTATPYRRDGHQPIIIMQCGPIRYSVSTKSVTEEGSFRQLLVERQTDFSCEWAQDDHITSIWPPLISDAAWNDLICSDVRACLSEGRSPIILTERKEHLELLRVLLEGSVEHLVVLHGGMKAPQRREMLQKLFNTPGDRKARYSGNRPIYWWRVWWSKTWYTFSCNAVLF